MSRGQGNFSYTAVPSPSESLCGKLIHQTSDSVSETSSDMLNSGESLATHDDKEKLIINIIFQCIQLNRRTQELSVHCTCDIQMISFRKQVK